MFVLENANLSNNDFFSFIAVNRYLGSNVNMWWQIMFTNFCKLTNPPIPPIFWDPTHSNNFSWHHSLHPIIVVIKKLGPFLFFLPLVSIDQLCCWQFGWNSACQIADDGGLIWTTCRKWPLAFWDIVHGNSDTWEILNLVDFVTMWLSHKLAYVM